MPGLVGRDRALLFLGVLDGLLETDLLGHLRLLHVVPVHRRAAVAQRPHERLVEEVLDHDGRVPEGHRRELVAPLFLVELGDVRLLVDVVVDDLAAPGTARDVEVDRPVEASRPHERGVEVGGAVGRGDHEDVRAARGFCFLIRRCAGNHRFIRSITAPAMRWPVVG